MEVIKRGTGKRESEQYVELSVTGPVTILKEPLHAVARLDMTWQEFLTERGIQLTPEDGMYIRTANSGNVKKNGEVRCWFAELHEPIRDFVSQYEGSKKKHTVKLMSRKINGEPSQFGHQSRGGRPLKSTAQQVKGKNRKAFRRVRAPATAAVRKGASKLKYTHPPAQRRRTDQNSTAVAIRNDTGGPGGDAPRIPSYSEVMELVEPQVPGYLPISKLDLAHFVEADSDDEEEMDDFNMGGDMRNAGCVSVESVPVPCQEEQQSGLGEVEEVDLGEEEGDWQRNGLQELDTKSYAKRRLGRFNNEILQSVRKEIKRLKRTNQWDRNVARAPLSCYLLEELFNKN